MVHPLHICTSTIRVYRSNGSNCSDYTVLTVLTIVLLPTSGESNVFSSFGLSRGSAVFTNKKVFKTPLSARKQREFQRESHFGGSCAVNRYW